MGQRETSAPPSTVIVYWCSACGWKALRNFNDEGLPCVRCLCPSTLRPVLYEVREQGGG